MNIAGSQADVYSDLHGLAALRAKAGGEAADKDEALKGVARQFETVFMKMMLKSMRESVSKSDLMGDDKSKFYESMYDDQLALDLTKRGDLGLAKLLVQQLGGSTAKTNTPTADLVSYRQMAIQPIKGALQEKAAPINKSIKNTQPTISSPEEFIEKLWPQAQQAAKELGVDAKVLLAQSALESGWGQHVMKNRAGESSHNLFGIKASHGWQGKTVSVQTLEYEQGVAVKRQADFRAYDSYQDSFSDYVQFLKQNPRYQQALSQAGSNKGFVEGLQKAGYATDPAYANKIMSILGRDQLSAVSSNPSVNLAQADKGFIGD